MLKEVLTFVLLGIFTQLMGFSSYDLQLKDGADRNYATSDTAPHASINVTSIQSFLTSGTLAELPSLGDVTSNSELYTYEFHDFGMVDIISSKSDGTLGIKTLFWDVIEENGEVSISIGDASNNHTHTLMVEYLDEDLVLVNYNGHQMELSSINSLSDEDRLSLNSELAGIWNVSKYPFDVISSVEHCGAFEKINGAYLSYEFNADGTYTKKVGSEMVAMEEQGIWDTSLDGRFVIFYPTIDGNPENTYGSQVAMIKELSDGTLVIGQALSVPASDFDTLFCTAPKEFELEKAGETSSVE